MEVDELKKYRNVILFAEIGALIHDLGKISEEFIESKSKNSKAKFLHHLILRRFISQGTEKDLVLHLIEKPDFFNEVQLDNPGQLTNILKDMGNELNASSRQSNLQKKFWDEFVEIQGDLQRGKSDTEQKDIEQVFTKIRSIKNPLQDQIKGEKKISSDFVPIGLQKFLNTEWRTHFALPFNHLEGVRTLGDFIEMHHETWHQDLPFLIGLLRAPDGCDGVDSGIDKSSPIEQQEFFQTYIATAFGYDRNSIVPSNLTQERIKFCKILESELQKILNTGQEDTLSIMRESRKKIMEAAEKHFSKALGETRRAANDVTLWDHSYSVASLFKAILAAIFLEHQGSESYTIPQPREFKWKILSININGSEFWMKSEKIGDIFGRKNLIKECFEKIKDLFEVEIPLGNEIYRDENCILFLVYDKCKKELELRSENMTLEEKIHTIFNDISKGELKPYLEISCISRGAATIGELLRKTGKLNRPFGKSIENHWENVKLKNKEKKGIEVDTCRVCGIRAVGFPHNAESGKAEKRHMCTICLERRKNRSAEWMKEAKKEKDTIWIDEIADSSNRVALVVGKFDLGNWLDSSNLNTIFTKTLFDLHSLNKEGVKGLNGYFDLLKAAKQSFTSEMTKIGDIRIDRKKFLRSIGQESYHNQGIDEYFKALVLDREKERLERELGDPDEWDVETKARLLVSFLFRKNPSFARTRRLWETTLNFWEEVDSNIRNIEKDEGLLSVDQRYKITFEEDKDISRSHTYYLRIAGQLIPAVAHDEKAMLIVEKEEKLPGPLNKWIKCNEELKEEIEILESDKQTSVGKVKAKQIEKHSTYIPYISILKEPAVFISLLPAEKAFEVVRQIREKYETEFSKVKNRVPLNVSIIFMNKKMPLYIALDCARRFLQLKNTEASLEVIGMCDRKLRNGEFKKKGLIFKGNRIFETEFDLVLGNGEIDYYHPYFIVEHARCPDQRTTYFETYLKERLLHIKDLAVTDIVKYTPSFFDFIFLDSNIRRFDVSMKNGLRPHTIFKKGPRPYYLEEIGKIHHIWEILEKYCDNTQLNNFETLLLSKIEEWNLTDLDDLSKSREFGELADASIKNILRISNENDFEIILDSVLSGMFFDVKELYHTILKRKLRGD